MQEMIRPPHVSSAHCLTVRVIASKSRSSSRSWPSGSVKWASNPAEIKIMSGFTFEAMSLIAESNEPNCDDDGVFPLTGTFRVDPSPRPCPVSPREPVPGYHGYWCIEKKKTL